MKKQKDYLTPKEIKQRSGWNMFLKDEDYDFDSTSLLQMLYYKISRMQLFFEQGKTCSVGTEKTAKQLKQVETLLHRAAFADEYEDAVIMDLDKKYGSVEIIDNQIKRPKVNDKNEKQYRREVTRIYTKARRDQDKALKKAFDLILKNYHNWWD